MAVEEETTTKKKRVVVESLGWLTESTIMPKKHKAIEGVGASSILELKAQLYKSQEESRLSRDHLTGSAASDVNFHPAKAKIHPHDPFSFKNSGVDVRAHKDKLELKAVQDGATSYAALEKKAEIYNKLVRGELSDEEDKEKYCVDFFRKGVAQEESQQLQANDASAAVPPENDVGCEDVSVLFNTKPVGPGRSTGARNQGEHIRLVREVHEEVNIAREKASELKSRRQEQVTARREKLKQAYLRKQLEKLRGAASKSDQTTDDG